MAELGDLLTAFVDGELEADDSQRVQAWLQADPEARRQLRRLYRQQLLLAELLTPGRAETPGSSATSPARARRRVTARHRRPARRWSTPGLIAALALLTTSALLLATYRKPQAPTTSADPLSAPAIIAAEPDLPERAVDGTWRSLPIGAELASPQEQTLRWQDGSTAKLRAGSLTVGDPSDGKELQLQRGSLLVTAAAQPKPLRVVTPHLTATVVGTVFTVSAAAERSRVTVASGRVRVEAREGGADTFLTAGQAAFIGAPVPLPVVMDSWVESARPAARHGTEPELHIGAAQDRRAYFAIPIPAEWHGVTSGLRLQLGAPLPDGVRLQALIRFDAAWDGGEANLCAHHDVLPHHPVWLPLISEADAVTFPEQVLQAGICTVVLAVADGHGFILPSREADARRHLLLTGL